MSLYKPTIVVAPSSDGLKTQIDIQPPSPVVSSATIMSYQLKVSGSGVEETMMINSTIRYYHIVFMEPFISLWLSYTGLTLPTYQPVILRTISVFKPFLLQQTIITVALYLRQPVMWSYWQYLVSPQGVLFK